MRIELPDPASNMTPGRKEAIILAVENGQLMLEAALSAYNLTLEEFTGWRRNFHTHGRRALRVTRAQQYR